MKKIPTSIKDHISNANYYLRAVNILPSRGFDAVHILLLLTAWENIKIAEEELHSYIQQTKTAKALHRSHAYKFRDVRKSKSIDRIIVKRGTPTKTISYSSGADFEELLSICRYGHRAGSKELVSTFETGWFLDDFKHFLISRIKWEEMMIKIYEDSLNATKI